MNRWPMGWRWWTALGIVIALATASTAGLHSITMQWTFLLPALIGAVAAAAAFVIAARWALLPGETLAVAIGLFVLAGVITVSVVAAGEFPSPSSVGDFFDALINGWADLLSAVSPADLTPRLSIAPFAIAWFGTVVACALLRWFPLPAAAVFGPLAGLALTVLLTDEDRTLSIVVGASIAVGALLLGFVLDPRRTAVGGTDAIADTDSMETTTSVSPHARSIRAGLVIAAVAVLAPLAGPHLPLADAHERYDLRDQVVPPWDPLSLPSPLVQLKGQLAAELEDELMFEVTSEEPLTRWSTAVMTSYDGIVWTVADPGDAGTDFRPVSSRLPTPDVQPASDPTVSASVTIASLPGPWLPVPGAARQLQFADPDPDAASAV
ncbi:MAG: transglutaminaseTgpA domain-containing protein, partial [Ilumatobacteraceae bacterium]